MKQRLNFNRPFVIKALVPVGLAAVFLPWLDAFISTRILGFR